MSDSIISKSTVIRGNDTLKVYSEEGVLQTPEPLKSYTPIVFYDILSNQKSRFSLAKSIDKEYEVLAIEGNHLLDDLDPSKNIIDDKPEFNFFVACTTIRDGKKINQRLVSLSNGKSNENNYILQPDEDLELHANGDFKSVTFWCRPCYVEKQITPLKIEVE